MRFTVCLFLAIGWLQARDWRQNPAVAEVTATAEIFAVGDIHSDYVWPTLWKGTYHRRWISLTA